MQSEIARDHSNHYDHADDVENHCFAPVGVLISLTGHKNERVPSAPPVLSSDQRHCWAIVPDPALSAMNCAKTERHHESPRFGNSENATHLKWTDQRDELGIDGSDRNGRGDQTVACWKVIMSVRLSVVAFGFKGSFAKFALPEFKTL
jgi:hypothetical protein